MLFSLFISGVKAFTRLSRQFLSAFRYDYQPPTALPTTHHRYRRPYLADKMENGAFTLSPFDSGNEAPPGIAHPSSASAPRTLHNPSNYRITSTDGPSTRSGSGSTPAQKTTGHTAAGSATALEMTARAPLEERQPLCLCEKHCPCAENGATTKESQVKVKTWSKAKTTVFVLAAVLLVAWCAIMAVMHHYKML